MQLNKYLSRGEKKNNSPIPMNQISSPVVFAGNMLRIPLCVCAWLHFFLLSSVFIHFPNNKIPRRTFSLILRPTVSLVCLSTFLTHSPNLLYQFSPQQERQEGDSGGIKSHLLLWQGRICNAQHRLPVCPMTGYMGMRQIENSWFTF